MITGQVEGVSAGVRRYTKCEVFLVYSLLSNSLFFDNVRTLRTDKNWDAIKPQKLDSLVSDYMFRVRELESLRHFTQYLVTL